MLISISDVVDAMNEIREAAARGERVAKGTLSMLEIRATPFVGNARVEVLTSIPGFEETAWERYDNVWDYQVSEGIFTFRIWGTILDSLEPVASHTYPRGRWHKIIASIEPMDNPYYTGTE